MAMNRLKDSPYGASAIADIAATLIEEAGLQVPAGELDNDSFIRLYREATDLLTTRAAQDDGKGGVIGAKEAALMCRCVLSCATLQEAIETVVEFTAMVYPRAGVTSLTVNGDRATFALDSERTRPSRASCLVDLTGLLSFQDLYSWLIGESLRVSSVVLAYSKRSDVAPFLKFFRAPVYLEGSVHQFEFEAAQLARPILRRPEELRRFLRTFPYAAKNLVGTGPDSPSIAYQVSACMDSSLARGEPLPGTKALAELLGASATTLRRRLRAEGTSFRAQRDLCLRRAAEHLLVFTQAETREIASQLGFTSSIAFRRAFRRWNGSTPVAFRRARSPAAGRPRSRAPGRVAP
jgi:AraC-like DNA-binding protein